MKKKIFRMLLIALSAVFFTLGIGVVALGFYIRSNFELHLPEDFFENATNGSSPRFFVYDFSDRTTRKGEAREVTREIFGQAETKYLSLSQTPEHLQAAFVAVEDKRFWEHGGVDWGRTALACVRYLLGDKDTFGGSTITQQLIKNVTGRDEVSAKRKIQEILYALDAERTLEKARILELYMNVIGFSDRCIGVYEASEHYFSKEPQALSVAEAASLAAIVNSPSYYNPIRHSQKNKERRDLILSLMQKQGMLDPKDYESAVKEPIALNIHEEPLSVHSWFFETVADDVIKDLSSTYGIGYAAALRRFYHGGLSVYTTMDESVQKAVEEYYKTVAATPTDENGVRAQSSLVVADAKTGDLLAVVGAIGEKRANLIQNYATHTLRPPGSAIKPLTVFAPAIELGLIDWASVYDDVPVRYNDETGYPWPKNANGAYRGLTDLSYAVAHSTNTVAVRILEELGCEVAFDFAVQRFGLHSLLKNGTVNDCSSAALALGQLNYGVTLRELTSAYTAFADGGVLHPSKSYYRVLDEDGGILLFNREGGRAVLSEESAALMTKLLEGVILEGTARGITLDEKVACAGKTGTSNNAYDRWFIGYTPRLVCGVWCGYEYPKPIRESSVCTKIWDDVMHLLLSKTDLGARFSMPDTLVEVSYCSDSGALASAACELDPRGCRIKRGWFVQGKEPTSFCERHVLCEYDEVGKGISHGECPWSALKRVALLQYQRSLFCDVEILDAQYLLPLDPFGVPINPDPFSPYYASDQGYFGVSKRYFPFNRSCPIHAPARNAESENGRISEDGAA